MTTWNEQKNVILRFFPKAAPIYIKSMNMPGTEQDLRAHGILDNPLRLAHYFATIGVESGMMTATRENMNYSKAQIQKVFGVGKHSAAVTATEAGQLARNPEALAERVYGLGNPKKAKELGNTMKGDGFTYRGIGPFQLTGKRAVEDAKHRLGLMSVGDLLSARFLFATAVLFWADNDLNRMADADNARALRKRVNGGYNGYAEFLALKNKIYKALTGKDAKESNNDVRKIQEDLNTVGYPLVIDGVEGPKTIAAVRQFQRDNGLKVDGIYGEATAAIMAQRLAAKNMVAPTDARISEETEKAVGVGTVGAGAVGEVILSVSREITGMGLDSPLLKAVPVVLMVVGLIFILRPMLKRNR